MAKKGSIAATWEQIPAPIKLAGGALFAWWFYTRIRNAVQAGKAAAQLNQVNQELDQFVQAGQQLSYPLGQYGIMADTLQVAMEGPWYDPTDEDAVKAVFNQLNHNADFLQMQKSFGIRDGWNLARWIRGDFNQDEINELNGILSMRGITYQF